MSRALGHPIALIVVMVLMPVSSAAAQSSQAPRTSLDIQAQIQKSAELQRQALEILTDPERAERLIGNAYAALQTAMSTMVINASDQKYPDPLLNLNVQRMRQALTHLQQASDMLNVNRAGATTRQRQEGDIPAESEAYLGVVRNSVEQALRITNSVFVF